MFFIIVTFMLGFILPVSAALPPPPVNQYLGIYDTDYSLLKRDTCLGCHVSDQALVQRHHALLNNTPPAKTYDCLTCHTLIDDGSGGYTFDDFRSCEKCHTSSPHHSTPAAAARHCSNCHGSFVNDFDDGHYIPTYQKSSVTPGVYGTLVTDPQTGQQKVTGGCGTCHQADPSAIDPATNMPKPIVSSRQTHHATGLSCNLCHNVHGAILDIRQCETCHGIASLHNIQKDSPAAASIGIVVPGEESPGWGHVGSNQDCNGCHLPGYIGSSVTVPAAATIPSIASLSSETVSSVKGALITVTGSGFVNSSNGISYNPAVAIGSGSSVIVLQPLSFSEASIQVMVPPLLPGNYDLRVVKNDKQSNRAHITALNPLSLRTAVISNNSTITIVGGGFGTPPPQDYASGLGVLVNGTAAQVLSWSDTKIVIYSKGAKAGDTVTVNALNGGVSTITVAANKKSR